MYPVLFVGHGSPIIALQKNTLTETFREIGDKIIAKYSAPKAILGISAHWLTSESYVASTPSPEQIYDFYGFPAELYNVSYPMKGDPELAKKVLALNEYLFVGEHESRGVDHGMWTALMHMFPEGNIPVVQLSINYRMDPGDMIHMGKKLATLRKEYLIIGSGNIVHNLSKVNFYSNEGTKKALSFDSSVKKALLKHEFKKFERFWKIPNASYAVATGDHFFPLLYVLGAANARDSVQVFNEKVMMDTISMTSYTFGMM